ncbi:energy-coupling factor transporter transmembrane component T family protein [Anaerorhabdus furcosa]|uniref:Energy-coupling factor transport system permease protein n=1 Tax=Anaerorhabdus furcosa TaxID=118967 RepID=A0A1T4L2W9_9FIRM|nr:energy-coupling factor transporter transmembrane component T [Anaerorhabdus furcosa]SJZ49069.1 energy-coupling factor transport system permease protein [Anaerorhabdus furcosa]
MNSFVLGKYIPLDSCIHRMDPRAKIMAMLIVLISIFFPVGWIGYGVLAVCIIGVVLLSKLRFDFIWKALKPMLFMLVFLLVLNVFVLKTGTLLFTIFGLSVYSDAIFQTLFIAVRLILMIMITTVLTATTKPLDLTLGIEDLLQPFQKIGVPSHEIAMLISIALRFIPDLIEETQKIMRAQASRGVDLKEGTMKEKIVAILSLIVPLFVSAFQRAEDLANAMESRGYAPGQERTRYKILKIKGRDIILLIGASCLSIGMIVIAFAV